MPDRIEEAREFLARGDAKQALKGLGRAYYDVQKTRDFGGVRRGVLLAQELAKAKDPRIRRKADEYLRWFGLLEESYSSMTPLQSAYERLAIQDDDPDLRVVRGCTVLGGYGFALAAGTGCVLVTFRGGIAVVPLYGSDLLTIDYDDVATFEIVGPGRVKSGGGFVGGGFGLVGAAEGLIVASVLNALTTRTSVTTIIHLATAEGEIIFHNGDEAPAALRITLSPIAGRLAGRGASASRVASDPVTRLKQLKELRDEGLLTPEEFEAARARVAGELS